jgi:phosphoglycerate dehydrogenase-like enzyme
LPELSRLQWIHATWAGIENLCYPELIERAPTVTNVRGASADAMSEHALMGLLFFLRDISAHSAANANKSWRRQTHAGLLRGSNVMVLGTGGIGQRLVSCLNALGSSVVGVNSDGRPVDGCVSTLTIDDAAGGVADVDHVVCTLPLTHLTEGIIDKSWFDRMKPHTVFVNISRGKVVNENDLMVALEQGQIRGAFLDVASIEPMPEDHPLWNTPNLFLTGHRSFQPGNPTTDPAFDVFKENLGYFLSDQKDRMINVVDFSKGY